MTKIIFSSLILSIIVYTECRMIYRRYEKENIEKNYVQIVEIFETNLHPPNFIENEKELNDFLGKDAFKTDMNCSSVTPEREETTKRITVETTTKPLRYPTSTNRQPLSTTPNPITHRPPNLDNMFTVRPIKTTTKTTIRPNPKENENPDYTELYNWPKNQPKPNVQVTKHLPTTIKPPMIVIQETDVQVINNQTNSINTSEKDVETTTEVITDTDIYDDDDNGTENGNEADDDYDENSYDLANENDHNQLPGDEIYSDEDDETRKRRKRLNKTQRRRKHIQSTKNLISKNS
ncbi:hypothetical protein ACKWTF_006119 [Chironomus riparius]